MTLFQITTSKANRKLIFISIIALFVLLCLGACNTVNTEPDVYHEATAQQAPGNATGDSSNAAQWLATCEELDITSCQEREDCNILTAEAYNREHRCIEDSEPVGCTSRVYCEGTVTYAEDSNGVCWQFSDTLCLPGWSAEEPSIDATCHSLFQDAKMCSTEQ